MCWEEATYGGGCNKARLECSAAVVVMCDGEPNLFALLFIGQAYRRYASELLQCQRDFVAALQTLQKHPQLASTLVLSDDVVPRVIRLCMHYLHAYIAVYDPKPQERLRRALLLVAILGLALKVVFQDYFLEHLPVRQQLALFDVFVETRKAGGREVSVRAEADSRCSTEHCSDDEADAALLDESQAASLPDLLHAKLQLEERVKHVLRYDFALESPLPYVQRFFHCAFPPEQSSNGIIS